MKRFFSIFHFPSSIFLLSTCYLLLATLLYSQSGWGPDTRLVFMQGGGWYPRAACWGDTIHLVWWQAYTGHDEIFYKRSTDAGVTWGADVMLSVEDDQWSRVRGVAVVGSVVHVVWSEQSFGLFYRRSTDGGSTWQGIDSVVPGMNYASICAVDDTVYIAGMGSDGILRFTKSYDGGNTWQPVIEVTKASSSPRIRTISNNILSLVISYAKGNSPVCTEVYQVVSYDGGQTWLDSVMVSQNDSVAGQLPAMDTDDSTGIHISWYDYKYSPYAWTGDIFYRASRDSGNSWEEIDSLTVMHRAIRSDILAEGSNLHLVWEDDRNGFDENFEIYYRMSTDLGRTWLSEERLTNAPYHSMCPSLACGGGYLHLFWQDRREYGNSGPSAPIYYKRKDLAAGIREDKRLVCVSSNLSLSCPTILTSSLLIRYGLGNNKGGVISLIDVTGRVMKNFPVCQIAGESVIPFNKEIQDGVYFIMLKSGSEYIIRKVLVVR